MNRSTSDLLERANSLKRKASDCRSVAASFRSEMERLRGLASNFEKSDPAQARKYLDAAKRAEDQAKKAFQDAVDCANAAESFEREAMESWND